MKTLKKLLRFVANPRLILCIAVAWMITNGWSYIVFALGTVFEIQWMIAVAGGYLAFLWLPVSPEKIATLTIALMLLRWWFPDDTRTLAVLKRWYENAKAAVRKKRSKK